MKIAVIGAGCSGLVTLKYLLDAFPAEDVICFEKGYSVRGVWGDQRADFVSTSTKYTTQFSCFRKWNSDVSPERDYTEFYRGSEFGDYLEAFAEHFGLKDRIRFGVEAKHLAREDDGWSLRVSHNGREETFQFDAVFICTGLANQKVPLVSSKIPVTDNPEGIQNKTVVVVGGGESAADVANHLAKAEYNNKVYLSLRSGIRVSPRYHPIRGVPSDFLRNRLLISFDKGARNWVGERFVTFRIRYDRLLAKWFPHQRAGKNASGQARALRRDWDLKLKARAKGGLFNVFHNKSDDFLDAVAEKRLQIIGPPTDETWTEFSDFEQTSTLQLTPHLLVFSTGYHSRLPDLSGGLIHLRDFYLGCIHTDLPNLFLVGFARPIIGNIPSISEIQARYAVGVLAGMYKLPADMKSRHEKAWKQLRAEYSAIDTNNVYPVEHIPYTDILAKEMGILPTLANLKSLGLWMKILLAPANTVHYVDEYFDKQAVQREKIYTPALILALMIFLTPLSWLIGLLRRVWRAG
jgi:hypothetical protein